MQEIAGLGAVDCREAVESGFDLYFDLYASCYWTPAPHEWSTRFRASLRSVYPWTLIELPNIWLRYRRQHWAPILLLRFRARFIVLTLAGYLSTIA